MAQTTLSSFLDLSKLMQLELAADQQVVHRNKPPHASSALSMAEPDEAGSATADSPFHTANPFDLLSDDGRLQPARQDSSGKKSITNLHHQAVGSHKQPAGRTSSTQPKATAASGNSKYVYYSNCPICGRCGVRGHTTDSCAVQYCQQCRMFGHGQGKCRDACKTCGKYHTHKQQGHSCGNLHCTSCNLYGHSELECPNIPCSSCGYLGHRNLECPGSRGSDTAGITGPVQQQQPKQRQFQTANNVRLHRKYTEEEIQQHGKQLLRMLQSTAGEYSRALASNQHKLSVLGRISPADMTLLLRQANVLQLLDTVYAHYMEGKASSLRPDQLLPEHAQQFEAAMQHIGPNILPTGWHRLDSWATVTRRAEARGEDKLQQYKDARKQVQLAAGKALAAAHNRKQQQQQQQQQPQEQQQVLSAEHFPPLQLAHHQLQPPANATPAVDQQPKQQQQEMGSRVQAGAQVQPSPAPVQQQQQHQVLQPSPVPGQQQQQHQVLQDASSPSPQLPAVVSALCSSLHIMLVQIRDQNVQLEQHFADQLLHVAELASHAKLLTMLQQQSAAPAPAPIAPLQCQQQQQVGVEKGLVQSADAAGAAGSFSVSTPAAATAGAAVVQDTNRGAVDDEDEDALLGLLIG